MPHDFEVLSEKGGGVPGVFGGVARDASEHVVKGPALNPRSELPESARSPPAVKGGKYEEGSDLLGGGVFSFGLEQEGSFGEGKVFGPGSGLLDAVEENHKEMKNGVAEEAELGGRPTIEGSSRVLGSSTM